MKDIFFISGVFRCGNTLLRSILNQNPNFYVGPNSFTPEIIYKLHLIKKSSITNESNSFLLLDNVIKNVFNNYYKSLGKKYIFDQGRWGTPGNYFLLKEYNFLPKKFIILLRPLEEIIASWIKLENPKNISIFCEDLFKEHGRIGQAALALKYLTEKDLKNLHIIKYDEFCDSPEKIIKNLYEFLNIKYFNHRFTDLNQVDIFLPQTIIRTKEIKKENYNYSELVPKEILIKYKEIDELFKKYGS